MWCFCWCGGIVFFFFHMTIISTSKSDSAAIIRIFIYKTKFRIMPAHYLLGSTKRLRTTNHPIQCSLRPRHKNCLFSFAPYVRYARHIHHRHRFSFYCLFSCTHASIFSICKYSRLSWIMYKIFASHIPTTHNVRECRPKILYRFAMLIFAAWHTHIG